MTPDLMRAILEAIGCYDIEITSGPGPENVEIELTCLWMLRDGQEWPITVQLHGHCEGLGSFLGTVEHALMDMARRVELSRLIHDAVPEIPRDVAEKVLYQVRDAEKVLWADDNLDDVPF